MFPLRLAFRFSRKKSFGYRSIMDHRILKLRETRIEFNGKSTGPGYRSGKSQKRKARDRLIHGGSRRTGQFSALSTALLAKPEIFVEGSALCVPSKSVDCSTDS